MNTFGSNIGVAVRLFVFTVVVTGILYPAFIWLVARTGGWDTPEADLLAPRYTDSTLFHPRPSASDYETLPASASNLGPTSKDLAARVRTRDRAFRDQHAIDPHLAVPADMLYASASGLDPHISLEAAFLQRDRVARQRHLSPAVVDSLIQAHTTAPQFSVFGVPIVNVVSLNDALQTP